MTTTDSEDPSEQDNPLYNTLYTLHRVSPLYHGHQGNATNRTTDDDGSTGFLSPTSLAKHAGRFYEILLQRHGLRGVLHVSADNNNDDNNNSREDEGGGGGTAKEGALVECRWTSLSSSSPSDKDDNDDDDQGIHVEIIYENIIYTAILLGQPKTNEEVKDEFTSLPLLLTRMPHVIRGALTEYLSNNFDTRITTPMKLPSDTLISLLEEYLHTLSDQPSSSSSLLSTAIRDIHLTISFNDDDDHLLRALEVTIASEDVLPFLHQGRDRPTTTPTNKNQPFMTALRSYLFTHLALRLDSQSVKISKIAGAGFLLNGEEGKVKIICSTTGGGEHDMVASRIQSRARRGLIRGLVERASPGSAFFLGLLSP